MGRRLQLGDQLAALHDAALAITAELSLDIVLQKIVDVARDLVGARYAALGVAGEDGSLVEFITSGLTDQEVAQIGAKPTGRGLLAEMGRARRSLRVPNIALHPARVGFPDHHPPMTSFLGAPLLLRGEVIGHLYLTDKVDSREFGAEDEMLIEMLAAQAAIAVENARLFAQSDEALQRKVTELKAERRKLQAILDQMPEGVAIVDDSAQNVLMLNRAGRKLLGVINAGEGAEHALRPVDASGERVAAGETPIFRSVAQGETVRGEQIELCRPDGSCFTSLANSAPLYDQSGAISGGIVVFQDITALKELDRLKDELISIISHELRNPLTAIRGRSQLMLRVARRDAARSEDVAGLEAIDAQVEKLAQMVRELLDVSQMRLGLLELHRQPTDLVALARQAVEQFHSVHEERSFRLDAEVDPLAGEWDAGRLHQVIFNLLENAMKYSPAGSEIKISISSRTLDQLRDAYGWDGKTGVDRWALLSVTDQGIGVPEEAQEHLFDRFYRAANAKGRAETGLGLGLYICREIVTQHGGEIWLQSAEGQGSTFYLALPVKAQSS